MIHVFDAGPMVAFLSAEPGEQIVSQILLNNPGECFAHFINLCEIYYIFFRRGGAVVAESVLQTLLDAGIQTCYDNDEAFWKEAATFKAQHPMALPDGFCLALGRRLGGTVVTTDHNEFDPLVPLGYVPILFIR